MLCTLLLACTQNKFSVFVSESRGINNSNLETAKERATPKQDLQVIRHENNEDSTEPSDREVVEKPHTSESHVTSEAVSTPDIKMPCFPFQYSPFVTMQRGSSGRRSRCKCCIF